MTAECTWTWGT